jgi:hypothetical protein
VQDASFSVAGLLFWWPVVRPWSADERLPRLLIPLYLFAATLPCDALSAFLVFSDRVVYHRHLAEPVLSGVDALADQQLAGAFMWVTITFLYLVPALVMTVRVLSPGGTLVRRPEWRQREPIAIPIETSRNRRKARFRTSRAQQQDADRPNECSGKHDVLNRQPCGTGTFETRTHSASDRIADADDHRHITHGAEHVRDEERERRNAGDTRHRSGREAKPGNESGDEDRRSAVLQ